MIDETFPVDGHARIEIKASSGSVSVEAGTDGEVRIEVDTRRPEDWSVYQTGNLISVSYERGLAERGGRARIRVLAPQGSFLNVATASADVRASLGLGEVSIATASGDVAVGDANSATIKTASGDVRVGTVSGDLSVKSASGDIDVLAVTERAATTTVSGDVRLGTCHGNLATSSASGDIRVQHYLGTDLEASTISGDVSVGLPSGRTVKLQAKTLSGSVRLPERKESRPGGGPVVSLQIKSVSGDVTISRLD